MTFLPHQSDGGLDKGVANSAGYWQQLVSMRHGTGRAQACLLLLLSVCICDLQREFGKLPCMSVLRAKRVHASLQCLGRLALFVS